jgi:hypothetical protein
MPGYLSNLLSNLGANLAHIFEAVSSQRFLTIPDNARFAPVFDEQFSPRLMFPDEDPNLRLLPNGWRVAEGGPGEMAPAPIEDPKVGEHNRMLLRDSEGDEDGEEYEKEEEEGDEDKNENNDENDDENDDEDGDRKVFSNGGTPWGPKMEDKEEEKGAYDPEMLLAAETKVT